MHFDYAQCKQKGRACRPASSRGEQAGFIGILVLVGLLIITLVFGYLYLNKLNFSPATTLQSSQTLDQSPQFQTYTNRKLGFELKFSIKNLIIKEDSEEEFNNRSKGNFRKNFKGYIGYEPSIVLGAVAVLRKEDSFDKSPLTIWVFENPDNLEAETWYKKFWYYPFLWGDFDNTKEKIKPSMEANVSGKLAKYGMVTYMPGKPKFVYLSDNGKMFLFRVLTESSMGDQILSTFKFLNSADNLDSFKSPDGAYTVRQENLGDHQKISITDKNAKIIIEDITVGNEKELGYGVKYQCQCGTHFKAWVNNSTFSIKVVNSLGEEYEYLVNAGNGKVDEGSFKRIK